MKAKRVVALVAGAALATGMAVGMTACKKDDKPKGPEALGTATLNVADYAGEYKSTSYYSQKGYKSIKTLITVDPADIVYNDASSTGLLVYEKNSKYNVYSLVLEKDVLTELTVQPQVTSVDIYEEGYHSPTGQLSVITVTDNTDPMKPKTAYYMADGSALLASDEYDDVSATQLAGYVGTDKKSAKILCVAGEKATADTVTKFYKVVVDEDTHETSYSAINASDIHLFNPEYSKGEVVGGLVYSLYHSSEEEPLEGDMKDYTVEYAGYNYNFYKNGEKTATVNLMDKTPLGYVGNNFYYYSQMLVDSDATEGYNVVEVSDVGTSLKYNYQLYKYDIVANTTAELNYDVVILGVRSMYNYTAKTYDAAYVTGYKMIDGVAYTGEVTYGEVAYITDKDLGVAYDLSGYDLGNSAPELSKLGNDLYLASVYDNNSHNYDYYIMDENLKPVNYVSSTNYLGEGLIRISSSYVGFTDLTGKVVIEPKYNAGGNLVFYDGIAYVLELNVDGGKEVLLKNDGTVVADIEALEKSTSENVIKDVNVENGYYTLTTTTEDETTHDVTVTTAYYTLSGTLLKSFSDCDNISDYITLSDGSKLIVVTKTDATTSATTYEYYKLAK